MNQDKDSLYWGLRQENDAFIKAQRHKTEEIALYLEAEHLASETLRSMGYQVNPTPHKHPFDLWVSDPAGRVARVEVKISTYGHHKRGGRYQANVRHHYPEADILIFYARNGSDWPFIIPLADIAPRRNVTIWSHCPGDHHGQWAQYLAAWQHLHRAIEQARPLPCQLSLLN